MNDHYRTLSEALTRISTASTAVGVWATLKDLGLGFGYTYLMAAEVPPTGSGLLDAVVYSDWRKQVIAEMAKSPDSLKHPFVCHAASAHAPFSVNELRTLEAFRDTDWSRYLPHNILEGDGLVVPVHRGSELMGAMVFAGEKPDTSPLARAILQVAAHAAVDRWVVIQKARSHGATIVAKPEGCEDRDAALAFKGAQVEVRRADFPRLRKDEFYWIDLVGCAVANPSGEALGRVVSVDDHGAHPILETDAGLLIPFVDAYVVEVAPAEGRIVVDWQADWSR
jgi:16S rRNA processing protein RimM